MISRPRPWWPLAAVLCWAAVATGQEAAIRVRADRPGREVSRFLTGACIEDVNHEIYGGIDSQMVFGESFQEPPETAVEGFTTIGPGWGLDGEDLLGPASPGPKLLADGPPLETGEARVRVFFPDDHAGAAGLILKVNGARPGADNFHGYEVSLNPKKQTLALGRHRDNWEPLREIPCAVPVGRWIALVVTMGAADLIVSVDGREVLRFEDRDHPLPRGVIGLRTWQRTARFRDLEIVRDGRAEPRPFLVVDPLGTGGVSGMWRSLRRGSATGDAKLVADRPFVGSQSQSLTFVGGEGVVGIENAGLNRRGMAFERGKPYEGVLWMRSEGPAEVFAAAEDRDGRTLAETAIAVPGGDWARYAFAITPEADATDGRFAIKLKTPTSISIGYALLQPGSWGRYQNLPVRKDVAEQILDRGLNVMRLGGLMANAKGYRWKSMIGPRDRRAPYEGYWYPYSSNGWGIFEFLQFCEAAKILPVVDVNLDETPQDLADLVEYANGPADSEWGRRRVEDGHPLPYGLKYLELGNEEAVDDAYWRRFAPLAEAIWASDPGIVLIVGDFEYKKPIADPMKFAGAPKITSLSAHQKILDLAKSRGREVWFDVHIWNHDPRDAQGPIAALATFDAALKALSPGAEFALCVLEENATNHAVRRALAHAETLNGLARMGDRVRIVCAANALQADGQNDDGWDQGLVFLDPARAWSQPPAYVTQMVARDVLPRVLETETTRPGDALDVAALEGEDGLSIRIVNVGDARIPARIAIEGGPALSPEVRVTQLRGDLDEVNTAGDPERIVPWERTLGVEEGRIALVFPPRSFTILRFRRE